MNDNIPLYAMLGQFAVAVVAIIYLSIKHFKVVSVILLGFFGLFGVSVLFGYFVNWAILRLLGWRLLN